MKMEPFNIAVVIFTGIIAAYIFRHKKDGPKMGISNTMKMSERGIDQLKREEGLRLETYLDEAGIPTIGYGHTGQDVIAGQKITEQQADGLLRSDLARFEKAVNDYRAQMIPIEQHEYDAMVSFAFNVGTNAFKDSTLLKKFNAGDKEGAANEFTRWVYITQGGNKVVSFVLTARREREKKMFLTGSYWL